VATLLYLGFAYLLQIDTGRAQAAFTRAITLDQADPMPRLGIARIRENKLEAGRIDIETAASLDPAKARDPHDPCILTLPRKLN